MTEEQIKGGFDRLESALAAPVDAPARVAHRIVVRRRRRRAVVAGGAALGVVLVGSTVLAALGGDDGSDQTVAVDPPSGPTSTLVMTRPDGSTYAFPDVTVSCRAPETAGGDPLGQPPDRIWMYSPMEISGSEATDDARATEPFVYFEAIVSKIEGDRTFTFPNHWSTPSDRFPLVLFAADIDGNEVASSAGGESGTVRVVEASCDPVPVLRLEVDMTLGSEVQKQPLKVTGTLR